jgi:hypothetical protein
MARLTFRKRLDASLRLKTVQGLLAFAIGAVAYFIISVVFYSWNTVGLFIFSNLTYAGTPAPWSAGERIWAYASGMLTTFIMLTILVTLVTAIMVLKFRWLGLKPTWKTTQRIFFWSLVANTVVFAFNYTMPFVYDDRGTGVILQTLIGYVQLLLLGLPYTFAWLWATRGQKSLDLNPRKR